LVRGSVWREAGLGELNQLRRGVADELADVVGDAVGVDEEVQMTTTELSGGPTPRCTRVRSTSYATLNCR